MEEKRTVGRDEDSARGRGGQLEENSGMSRGQRGVQQEERTATTGDIKMDCLRTADDQRMGRRE